MKFAVDKIRNAGNNKVMLTERGTHFRLPGPGG